MYTYIDIYVYTYIYSSLSLSTYIYTHVSTPAPAAAPPRARPGNAGAPRYVIMILNRLVLVSSLAGAPGLRYKY